MGAKPRAVKKALAEEQSPDVPPASADAPAPDPVAELEPKAPPAQPEAKPAEPAHPPAAKTPAFPRTGPLSSLREWWTSPL
jgi:hypothetical protein